MTHVPPTPLSDTGSQFSLRQAFILLTFFSVAFAALALRMQWLTSAAKLQMTFSLLVAICCAVLGYALSSLSNAHARKSAGTSIAKTNTPVINKPTRRLLYVFQAINLLLLVFMCDPDFASGVPGIKWFNIVMFAGCGGGNLVNLCMPHSVCVAVCERGIIGFSLVNWRYFKEYAWDESQPFSQLTITPWHGIFSVKLQIAAQDRAKVQKQLDAVGLKNSPASSRT